MNGYILKSMERIDFQLSSQVSMLDEANEADIVLAKAAESKPEIQWKIVSYGELRDLLAENPENATIFLTRYSLPYKNQLKKTYPLITILEDSVKDIPTSNKAIVKYENWIIGIIVATLLILIALSLIN